MAVLRGLAAALSGATSRALDLALPATCSGCGREGEPLCSGCAGALDARLGLPGARRSGCRWTSRWGSSSWSGVRRSPAPLRRAPRSEVPRRTPACRPLGLALARRWRPVGEGATLVVPVPIHAERERQRGYDQAALLAEVRPRAPAAPRRALERERATMPSSSWTARIARRTGGRLPGPPAVRQPRRAAVPVRGS